MMPGAWEFAALAVLALLIFGPDKLPQIARSTAKTVSSFRREAQTAMDELKRSADVKDFTEAAGEFRSVTRDLRQQMSLNSPSDASERSAGTNSETPDSEGQTGRGRNADAPAPYDPYAT